MKLRDWTTSLAALAAVAVSIFAVGGVHRWSQAIVAALAAAAVASTALSRRSLGKPSPLVVLLGVAAGLTALQLLLPGSLNETTAALRTDGAALLGTSPWERATADAGATTRSLVMLLTLLGIAAVALRISTSERGRYRIVAAVALLCGLAAVVTGIHKLFGLSSLYGLYDPEYAEPQLLGPILNANTLACLTAVGAVLGIGLAAHRRQRGIVRAGWLLLVAACGAVTTGTISRGGTLALLGGGMVTIAILIAQRFTTTERTRKRRGRIVAGALPLGILAGCFVVLAIYSSAGNVERQLSELSFKEMHYSRSKFAAWRSATALVEESPWIGVGRGAFESAFTRVHEASGLATYAFLENEYIQAVVDWGVPGSLLLVVVLVWLGYTAIRRWRDGAVVAGPVGALVVVAMQSNVDFGLEFLGLAAPVTALAATLTYVPLRESTRPVLARSVRALHAAALLAGAGLLLSSFTTTLDEDRRALGRHATLALARESATRHPLDFYSFAIAAELYSRAKDPRAIPLLNHAMTLHPTHPQLHRMAARMLLAIGRPQQAAIEYAAALRTTPDPRPLLKEIVTSLTAESAASALPIDYAEPAGLVTALQDGGHPDVARAWLLRVLDLNPRTGQACDLLFKLAESGDVAAAEAASKRCVDRMPDYQTRSALARLLVSKGQQSEAIRLLRDVENWQSRREEKVDAWLILCDAQLALGYRDEAKRCLRRLDASADMLDERRTELLKRIEAINSGLPVPAPVPAPPAPATGSASAP